jgi:hypothetical protein
MLEEELLGPLKERECVGPYLTIIFEVALARPSKPRHSQKTLGIVRHIHVVFSEKHDRRIEDVPVSDQSQSAEESFRVARSGLFNSTTVDG